MSYYNNINGVEINPTKLNSLTDLESIDPKTSQKLKCIEESNEMIIDDDNITNNISESTKNTKNNNIKDSIPLMENDNEEGLKFFSKRILCELIKSEVEECEIKEITEIANSLNPVLDIIINKNKAKISIMKNFITYFIEVDSELVKTFPEHANLKDEIIFRFIILAKNIYNFSFEVYFSLYDLYNVSCLVNKQILLD
jgi:hypothetical protein